MTIEINSIKFFDTQLHNKDGIYVTKNLYPAYKICYGKCECGEDYVGETIRNTAARWSKHNNPTHKSEPAQHIKSILNICLICPYYAMPHLMTENP